VSIDSNTTSCFPWLARILPLFVANRFSFGFFCLDTSYNLLIVSKASTTILWTWTLGQEWLEDHPSWTLLVGFLNSRLPPLDSHQCLVHFHFLVFIHSSTNVVTPN
jgi:hypothetical protein